jgi:glutamine synthetase
VLSRRELESRFEVWVEQYSMRANIEAETTSSIARTLLVPATLRYLALIDSADSGMLEGEVRPLLDQLLATIADLTEANAYPDGVEGIELAEYARDNQLPAMEAVRGAADKLEKLVADDLWPLPKYEEMLFIK